MTRTLPLTLVLGAFGFVQTAEAKAPFDPYMVSDVAEKVTPAVVNITTRRAGKAPSVPPIFRDFFGPGQGRGRGNMPPVQMGAGSGVIVSSNGGIVTNNHVVEGADEITVTLSNRREFKATVVGVDKASDLAFLKVDAKNLPYLEFGDSSKLRLGEFVLAVGNPFGVGQTVTMGIVSAKGRANVGIVDYEDFIQTDAAINPGNSGGALVNLQGQLVGINTAILSRSGGAQGIGFAVPSNMVSPIRNQISEYGRVRRGWLGVAIQDVTPSLARNLELGDLRGVLVSDVMDGGPAATAKLAAGDVVVAVDDKPTRTSAELRNRIALTAPGSKTKLSVVRDGRSKTITVTLAEKDEEGVIARLEEDSKSLVAGLAVEPLDANLRSRLDVPARVDGVVVSRVESGSPAERAGIAPGNLITAVNRNPVRSPSQFASAIEKDADEILLRVYRRGMFTFVVLRR
ncbi:MAG: DegQ family serine endoprotease [Myxococcota bacterium]